MADREARLKLVLELINQGKVTDGVALLRKELQSGGQAAQATTGALVETAAAADAVADAEMDAAAATAALAGALATAADTASAAGQKTAAASAQGAQAVEGVTARVKSQTAATREAGAAAVDSGEDVERAAREAGSAVDKLTRDWQETIEAAQAAGLAFDFDTAVASAEELAQAVRTSGDSLENQRAALEGIAAQLAEDFAKMESASEEAGVETEDQAKAIEAALKSVRSKIDEVNVGLLEVGPAADAGAGEAATAFLSVDAALKLANQSAVDAATKLQETGRLPKREITELAEVIETVKIAMEEAARSGVGVTEQQISSAQALEGRLEQLTAITNRQTDASGDNAVALKDQAAQFAQLSGTIQQLITTTSAGSAGVAKFFGYVGAGVSTFDQAKNTVKAMDLNTLSLSASLAKLAGQFGLVVAALLASTTAGSKFSGATSENVKEVDRLQTKLKDIVSVRMKDYFDGVNLSLQGQNGAWSTYLTWLTLGLDGLNKTGSELRFMAAAMRDGLTELEAERIATEAGAKAWQFYVDTRHAGTVGLQLWQRALRESEGDSKRFEAFIKAHAKELAEATAQEKLLVEARNESKAATTVLANALGELDRILKSDAAQFRRTDLEALIATVTDATGKVKSLGAAERERLAIIIEVLARGDAMTKDQQAVAAGLLAQARAGEAASAVINTLTRLYIDFDIATDGSTKRLSEQERVLSALTQGWTANMDIVRQRTVRAAADMQALLDKTDNLTDAQRAHFQAEIDWLNAVEAERERIESLAAARTGRLASETVDAERRVSEAIRARLDDLRSFLPASDTYAAVIAATSGELADLAASHTALSRVERERLTLITELSAKGSEMNAVERQLVEQLIAEAAAGVNASKALNDLAAAKVALAAATEGVTLAANGSTLAINLNLQKILELIPAGEQHSVVLEKLAAALRTELSVTDGITKAQRERIETIAMLAEKSDELTAYEKRYAEALIASVQAGNRHAVAFTDVIAVEQKRTESIREQIAALQEQIALMEQQQGVTEDQTAVNMDQGVSVDYLRQKQAALQRELGDGLSVWNASNEAQKQEADIAVERLARMHEEAMVRERQRTAESQIIKVLQDGRVTYTNLTEAQNSNIASAAKVADSHDRIQINAGKAAAEMARLQGTIPTVTVLMDGLRTKSDELARAIANVDERIRRLNQAAAEAAQ